MLQGSNPVPPYNETTANPRIRTLGGLLIFEFFLGAYSKGVAYSKGLKNSLWYLAMLDLKFSTNKLTK